MELDSSLSSSAINNNNNKEENEDVIENFLRTHPHCSLESPPLNPSIFDASRFTDGKYVKFFPHRDGTDGFFIAVMKKQGS